MWIVLVIISINATTSITRESELTIDVAHLLFIVLNPFDKPTPQTLNLYPGDLKLEAEIQ